MAAELVSAEAVAAKTGTSLGWVYSAVKSGRIPVYRIGDGPKARMRFDLDAVFAALAGTKVGDPGTIARVAGLLEEADK